MYFKEITQQILDKRAKMEIENVDWQEYADMFIIRLSSQVQQYGGFTPVRRVS